MVKKLKEPFDGIFALPAFPLVLVTAQKNIMTAAAFHFYSFEPPSVMVGVIPENLTYRLIEDSGEFGINIPTKDQLDKARLCGSISGRDHDKFSKGALTPQKAMAIDSFLIKECPVNLECRVVHKINYPGSHAWFIGKIESVHIAEGYTRDQALMYWLTEYRSVGELILKVEPKE